MKRRAAVFLSLATFALFAWPGRPVRASEVDEDARVIEQLRRAGSNLSKPHAVDFYIYLPHREAAESVASQLNKQGYYVAVRPASKGKMPWLALATRSMLVTVGSIGQSASLIRQVIAPHKGEYDGWETAVVR